MHQTDPCLAVPTHLEKELKALANPDQAKNLSRFFKTGIGEYGEGDLFLGIKVPQLRKISKAFRQKCSLEDITLLLQSPYHEMRFTALLILVEQFKKAEPEKQHELFNFYLKHTSRINNWDLIDTTAPHIIGAWLSGKDTTILEKLASSSNLWERRIAILATFCFIRNNSFDTTLKIARMLLFDKHDLIHKAVGWMLREVGKRDSTTEELFLKRHYRDMPRTMLRYAIERFPRNKREAYLKGEIL